jgi:hypothetical protein
VEASLVGIVFVAIAVIFLAVALNDYLRAEGKLSPARRTWIRVAIIFASIGILLHLIQTVLR